MNIAEALAAVEPLTADPHPTTNPDAYLWEDLSDNPLSPQGRGKGGVIETWVVERLLEAAGDDPTLRSAVRVLVRRHAAAADRLHKTGELDLVNDYKGVGDRLRKAVKRVR